MEQMIISLVSGAVGGTAVGTVLKKLSLGKIGDALVGVVGGGVGSYAVGLLGLGTAATPAAADAAAGMDWSAILNSVGSGAVGGGVLLAVVGVVKGMMAK
jgi:hypothetical protein